MDAVKMAEAADVIGIAERPLLLQPAGCPVPTPSSSSSSSSTSSSSSSSASSASSSATAAQCPEVREGSVVLRHGSTFDGAARVLTPLFTPVSHPINTTAATTAQHGGGRGGSGAESPKLGSGTDVLTIDARSLLRFSACGFDDAASAIDFNQRVVDLLFLGQYSFCGEERNPNVDAMLRTARAQGLPEEPLLLKRRNCTGQVVTDDL